MLEGSIEDNTLTALCWNERLAPQIALKVEAKDFSTEVYRRVAAAGLDFLNRHHRPAKAHIGDLLEHDIKRGANGQFTQEIVNEMERLAPQLNDEHVLGELDKFLEIQKLTAAVNQASDFLISGELERAKEVLRAPQLLPKDKPGVWLGDEEWFSFLREEINEDRFSSGIEVLDEHGIRPGHGEMFILLGAAGRGKSWFLINAGRANLHARKSVLHLTLENTLDMTLQRYTQCFCGLTKDDAKSVSVSVFPRDKKTGEVTGRPKPDNPTVQSIHTIAREEMLARLETYLSRGKLLIKHFPSGALSYGHLVSYLDTLELVHGFKPDVVILDYMTLMDVNVRDYRISIGKLAQNLRGLASMRNFALMTVAQGNRLSKNAKQVTSNHVAEDWSIVATSDTFITYSQTDEEKNQGLARILVDKSRKSNDKWLALITQSYDMGQFCIDSEYMSKYLESEVALYLEGDEAAP
jgi:DnaB-like helicase C terminal domain